MGEKADASGARSLDVELRDVHPAGTTPRHPRLPAIMASCAPDDFFRLEQSSVLQTSRYRRALPYSVPERYDLDPYFDEAGRPKTRGQGAQARPPLSPCYSSCHAECRCPVNGSQPT